MDAVNLSGGAIDDNITDLAYDSCGALWVTNAVAVNVVALNGTVSRINGLPGGLPMNYTRSVTRDDSIAGAMWVGTPAGLLRYAPGEPTMAPACYEQVWLMA